MPYKKTYRRSYPKRSARPYRQEKTKTMVTGKPPTLVEKIASGVGSVATLARAVAPAIAAINTELKYVDGVVTNNPSVPGTNDTIQLLSSIVQGTDDNQRIGNSILAKDITVKLIADYIADATTFSVWYRFTLLVWKANANSNTPNISKIFEQPNVIHSAFNKDYTDQMVILKDKIIPFNLQVVLTGNQSAGAIFLKIYKKLNFHMRWLNATTGVTENHVYLVSRFSEAVGNQATVAIYSRLNFTDN